MDLVNWLKEEETKAALLFDEEVDSALVAEVTDRGYAPDLDEAELEIIRRDPFLVASAFAAGEERFVVTFEVSAPNKQRADRKIPDVCNDFDIDCGTLFDAITSLDSTTDWKLD